MTAMEFEELQKIWDAQNNQPLYVINEQGLHSRILSKKNSAGHTANFTEWLLMLVNTASGTFVLSVNLFKTEPNISLYFLSLWMFGTALYTLISRTRRLRGNNKFDRSMRGDLSHGIALATYQVRLSLIMRWNILPMAIFVLLGLWESGNSIWMIGGILIFFVLAYFAGGWEHRIYKRRKRELEILQAKLEEE